MRWEQMILIEPRLLELYNEARRVKRTSSHCANQGWYGPGGLKSRMVELVGWDVDGVLGTCEAYDTAYRKIYDALPIYDHEGVYC